MEKHFLLLCLSTILVICALGVQSQCKFNEECINVKNCPFVIKLLEKNPLSTQDVQRIKNLQCGYDQYSNQPKVCCTKEVELTPVFIDLQSNLLPDAEVCGADPSKRIVGGQLTLLRQFPWVALLQYQKPNGMGFHCGGSLINNNYVLTAAHCILRIPKTWKLVSVRLGEHQLDTDPDCEDDDKPGFEDCADSPIDVPVGQITVHSQYNPSQVGQPNDIALIRLSRPVSYTSSIQPVCLPTSSDYLNNDFTETSMMVAGFGRTETRSQSNIKLKLEIPIKAASECSSIYKRHGVTLTDKQFCAGGIKGQDSCTGDSGGPVMHLHKTPTEYNWYLYGVVSFGPIQCGIKDFPGIYTNVPKHMPWVISNLKP